MTAPRIPRSHFFLLAMVLGLSVLVGCTATGATADGLTGAPCTGRSDCGGDACLPVAAGDRVCTTDCVTDEQCMPGWTCGGFGGLSGTVCLCDAHPEVCDGDDDDCDGLVDEDCAARACGDGICDVTEGSPEGVPGCCGEGGPATLEIVCREGWGSAADFYLHVAGAAADMCVPYPLTYRGTPGDDLPL